MLLDYLALFALTATTIAGGIHWARFVRSVLAGRSWYTRLSATVLSYTLSTVALAVALLLAWGFPFIPLVVPLWLLTQLSADVIVSLSPPSPNADGRPPHPE